MTSDLFSRAKRMPISSCFDDQRCEPPAWRPFNGGAQGSLVTETGDFRAISSSKGAPCCQWNNGAAKWDLKNIVDGVDWCEIHWQRAVGSSVETSRAMFGTVTRSFCVSVDLLILLVLSEWKKHKNYSTWISTPKQGNNLKYTYSYCFFLEHACNQQPLHQPPFDSTSGQSLHAALPYQNSTIAATSRKKSENWPGNPNLLM